MVLGRTVYLLAVAAVLQEVSGYIGDLSEAFKLRIYNGDSIPIEDAPYMAALQRVMPPDEGHIFFCGASIIHERFLLTAAHCFVLKDDETKKHPTIAAIGSARVYEYNNTNTIIEVEKVLCHEGFSEPSFRDDICLLKLKKPVRFGKKIAKIQLADKRFIVKAGTTVNVTGWGETEAEEDSLETLRPLDLLRTTIQVLSSNYCRKADPTVRNTMICAGVEGSGACYGDSGGPLVYRNVLIGVVSRLTPANPDCGSGIVIYTKVNSYLDWIHTTIANNL